jgi:hypothetical protein
VPEAITGRRPTGSCGWRGYRRIAFSTGFLSLSRPYRPFALLRASFPVDDALCPSDVASVIAPHHLLRRLPIHRHELIIREHFGHPLFFQAAPHDVRAPWNTRFVRTTGPVNRNVPTSAPLTHSEKPLC